MTSAACRRVLSALAVILAWTMAALTAAAYWVHRAEKAITRAAADPWDRDAARLVYDHDTDQAVALGNQKENDQ